MGASEPPSREGGTPSPRDDRRDDPRRDPGRDRPSTPADRDDLVDEASEESFPASDPPSWEPLHLGDPGSHEAP